MRGLMHALKGKRDGSILAHHSGLFGGGVGAYKKTDETKILRHVFENKPEGATYVIAQKPGLEANSVINIPKLDSPILIGLLAQKIFAPKMSLKEG